MVLLGEPRKTIRDYRFEPEKALAVRRSIIKQLLASSGRVLAPYFPRLPIPAGDELSSSGTRVDLSELAPDVVALLNPPINPTSDVDTFTRDFVYNGPTITDYGPLSPGATILSAQVIIITTFDDPDTVITLGLVSATGSILDSSEIDPTRFGTYNNSAILPITVLDALRLQVVPGISTRGAGRVIVTVRRP